MKFFLSKTNDNIVFPIKKEITMGNISEQVFEEMTPNTIGAPEKHIPVIKQTGTNVTVEIGSIPHPMIEEHYIEWICLETNKGIYVKYLKPGEDPKASFTIEDKEVVITAYDYCNIHRLWKK